MPHKPKYFSTSIGLFALIIALSVTSCKSRKKAQAQTGTQTTETPAITSFTTSQVFSNLTKEWNFYSAKAKTAVEGGGIDKTFDVTLKMQKDQLIWASIGMFGFEGGRVFMEKDSITILNKLGRTFTRKSWNQIEGYTGSPINLAQLQSIIMGSPMFSDTENFVNDTANKYFYLRKTEQQTYELTTNVLFTEIVKTFFIGQKSGKHLTVNYNKFKIMDNKNIPNTIDITAKDGQDLFNIKMELNDINLNSFDALPTTIPSSYIRN